MPSHRLKIDIDNPSKDYPIYKWLNNQLNDLTQQLAGKEQTGQDQQQQDLCRTADSNQPEWAAVVSETKRAFVDYQADQAAGKSPNYTKIGGVVETSFCAYDGGGDDGVGIRKKRGLADIGKEIAAGFSSGGGTGESQGSGQAGDGVSKSVEDRESCGTKEGDVVGLCDKRGWQPQNSFLEPATAAEEETDLTGKRPTGQDASYKTWGSQAERHAEADASSEKAVLDKEEDVFAGSQVNLQDAASVTQSSRGEDS
ncbi:hypothetical protein CTA2_9645 [Colletotrichum tanaceti]|nr:hypothetical protein CTA2_9645 [Colletotrichum tanaceti]